MIFLNLIASCLLACGVASSSVRVSYAQFEVQQDEQMYLESPKCADFVNESLYRQYVIKNWQNDYDNIPFFVDSLFDHEVSISITRDATTHYTPLSATYIAPSDTVSDYELSMNYELFPVQYFYMTYRLNVDNVPNSDIITVRWSTDGHDEYTIVFGQGRSYPNTNLPLRYVALYFMDYYVIDDDQKALFYTIFTSDYDEEYFTSYSGWYHMTRGFYTENFYYANVCGSMLYYQGVYNFLMFSRQYVEGAVNNISVNFYFYSNGYATDTTATPSWSDASQWLGGQTNVLMSACFMPVSTKSKLEYYGAFTYIPLDEDYGLDDLFISIADTPVTFITSLFSFELFGTTFTVAFLSIVTVFAIIFIIKKVL